MIPLEKEVSIGSKVYSIGRLSAFDQMHLIADARDILTALALLKRDRPKDMSDPVFMSTVSMITTSMGAMPTFTRERVWNLCLGLVKRRESGGYQPIMATSGQLQFADIDPPLIARLLYEAFDHNKLLDFFSDGLSVSDGPKTTRDGSQSEEEKTG